MKYMGSKNRIAKYILPIIIKNRKKGQYYVEPFVGGANLIDKVIGNRIGSDINEYLIEALKLIRDDVYSLPKSNKDINENDYKKIKNSLNTNKGLSGYYGFALSYGGKWFGGWCRDKEGKRDYISEAYRNAIKQSPKLKDVQFICSSYDLLEIPKNSIIYCDIPYKNTTDYHNNKFNYIRFWDWCRKKHKEGHILYISEYKAPSDFKCIWEKKIVSSLTKNTGNKTGIEKLFICDL